MLQAGKEKALRPVVKDSTSRRKGRTDKGQKEGEERRKLAGMVLKRN